MYVAIKRAKGMYKDKDKQREANRERQRRYRESHPISGKRRDKGVGVTVFNSGDRVTPKTRGMTQGKQVPILDGPKKRGKDIKCFKDLPIDVQRSIDRMSTIDGKIDQTVKANHTAIAINYQHTVGRYEPTDAVCSGVVTGKPGDVDYNGICIEEWRAERGR